MSDTQLLCILSGVVLILYGTLFNRSGLSTMWDKKGLTIDTPTSHTEFLWEQIEASRKMLQGEPK